MARSIVLMVPFFLCASMVAAHEQAPFDTRHASPGLRLELIELGPLPTSASAGVRYRLRVFGLPRDILFGVWAKDFGHAFHQMASGFRLEKSGAIVSRASDSKGHPKRLDELVLSPGPYPRGAAWQVALASADGKLTAFALAIPRPISTRDGTCTVSLELASRRGDRFVVSGTGFAPGESVSTELRYLGQAVRKTVRTSGEGRLTPDALFHGGIGHDHGARYTVKGRSCEVSIDYEWGEPALAPG